MNVPFIMFIPAIQNYPSNIIHLSINTAVKRINQLLSNLRLFAVNVHNIRFSQYQPYVIN